MSLDATKTRIVATDNLHNRSFIYWRNGHWCCALSNGTPASLFYAGIMEHMACILALDDADTAEEVMATVQAYGSKRYQYTFFTKKGTP